MGQFWVAAAHCRTCRDPTGPSTHGSRSDLTFQPTHLRVKSTLCPQGISSPGANSLPGPAGWTPFARHGRKSPINAHLLPRTGPDPETVGPTSDPVLAVGTHFNRAEHTPARPDKDGLSCVGPRATLLPAGRKRVSCLHRGRLPPPWPGFTSLSRARRGTG